MEPLRAGQVFAWDVVNEALDENGNVRSSIWYDEPGIGFSGHGTEYIEQVLRWAHEADPHALLFYNEAEGEGLNRKSDAIYTMVKDFKRLGIPIDGVGLQMHISLADADIPGIAANISANIARLTALGVQVHITELDVSLPLDSSGSGASGRPVRQADVYRAIVRACLNSAGCTAIQTWGFTDKYSWIGSHSRGARGQALPFDRGLPARKPPIRAVLEENPRRPLHSPLTGLAGVAAMGSSETSPASEPASIMSSGPFAVCLCSSRMDSDLELPWCRPLQLDR